MNSSNNPSNPKIPLTFRVTINWDKLKSAGQEKALEDALEAFKNYTLSLPLIYKIQRAKKPKPTVDKNFNISYRKEADEIIITLDNTCYEDTLLELWKRLQAANIPLLYAHPDTLEENPNATANKFRNVPVSIDSNTINSPFCLAIQEDLPIKEVPAFKQSDLIEKYITFPKLDELDGTMRLYIKKYYNLQCKSSMQIKKLDKNAKADPNEDLKTNARELLKRHKSIMTGFFWEEYEFTPAEKMQINANNGDVIIDSAIEKLIDQYPLKMSELINLVSQMSFVALEMDNLSKKFAHGKSFDTQLQEKRVEQIKKADAIVQMIENNKEEPAKTIIEARILADYIREKHKHLEEAEMKNEKKLSFFERRPNIVRDTLIGVGIAVVGLAVAAAVITALVYTGVITVPVLLAVAAPVIATIGIKAAIITAAGSVASFLGLSALTGALSSKPKAVELQPVTNSAGEFIEDKKSNPGLSTPAQTIRALSTNKSSVPPKSTSAKGKERVTEVKGEAPASEQQEVIVEYRSPSAKFNS